MVSHSLPRIHVLHENPAWLPPLREGFEAEQFDVHPIHINEGSIDPAEPPAEGIWINRISPSSHTRGHAHSVELTRHVLFWLESHHRRVINGLPAFELEMSKLRQDLVLRKYGISTPRTVLAVGREHLIEAAGTFNGPFITKHDQGGKGLGIQLFSDTEHFKQHLYDGAYDAGPGDRLVLQEYIVSPEPFITRVELIGGRFLFAMRSSTTDGFELCPSDACQSPAPQIDVCPAEGTAKFSPSPVTAVDPLIQNYQALCTGEGIEIAGIEFIEDAEGRRYTYDINGTTNYSGVLGAQIGIDGMREFAGYVRREVVPELDQSRRMAS